MCRPGFTEAKPCLMGAQNLTHELSRSYCYSPSNKISGWPQVHFCSQKTTATGCTSHLGKGHPSPVDLLRARDVARGSHRTRPHRLPLRHTRQKNSPDISPPSTHHHHHHHHHASPLLYTRKIVPTTKPTPPKILTNKLLPPNFSDPSRPLNIPDSHVFNPLLPNLHPHFRCRWRLGQRPGNHHLRSRRQCPKRRVLVR